MNRRYKDYMKTFISMLLLLLIIISLVTLSVSIKYRMLNHMLINFQDKPIVEMTVYADSPNLEEDQLPPRVYTIPKKLEGQALIQQYVREICAKYDNKIKPELVMAIIEQESNYKPQARNGTCLGLMQISNRWHADRAIKLGVTNFYDSYGNILLGVDYLNELLNKYKDVSLVLMLYNMNHNDAIKMYSQGQISSYAKLALAKANDYKKGKWVIDGRF